MHEEEAPELEFAEVIGAAFHEEVNGVGELLDQVDHFVSFTARLILPEERQISVRAIARDFARLMSEQSNTVAEASVMVNSIMKWKQMGLALAKKIDNERLIEIGEEPHEIRNAFFAVTQIQALASTWKNQYKKRCDEATKQAVAGKVRVYLHEWLELARRVKEELEVLEKEKQLAEEHRDDLRKRIEKMETRICILSGAVVALGMVAGGTASALPAVAATAGGVAVVVAIFAGLTLVAKGSVMRLLLRKQEELQALEGAAQSAAALAQGYDASAAMMRRTAQAIDSKTPEQEVLQVAKEVLETPRGNSLMTITLPVDDMSPGEIVELLRATVMLASWGDHLAAWELDVKKIVSVNNDLIDYTSATDQAKWNLARGGKEAPGGKGTAKARMTE